MAIASSALMARQCAQCDVVLVPGSSTWQTCMSAAEYCPSVQPALLQCVSTALPEASSYSR